MNCTTAWISYDQATAGEKQIQSLTMTYVKQNAGEDLNWRPTKEWNLGVAYGFERYDWTQADVDYTNENSGKVYVDWKPMSWLGIRSSAMYSCAALRHLRLRRFRRQHSVPQYDGGGQQLFL